MSIAGKMAIGNDTASTNIGLHIAGTRMNTASGGCVKVTGVRTELDRWLLGSV